MSEWPFVARSEEFRVALGALVTHSEHSGVILRGDGGVGKTTLAHLLAERLVADGWKKRTVLGTKTGRAVPLGAFNPVVFIEDAREPAVMLSMAYRELAAGEKTLLVVDDAQYLDPLSALLVSQLAMGGRLRLIVTCRSGEPVHDAIAALWKEDLLLRVDLEPFSRSETAELVSSVVDGEVDDLAVDRLQHLSSGSPLILRGLVTAALSDGALTQRDGRWAMNSEFHFDPDLTEVVESQLNTLTPAQREVAAPALVADFIDVQTLERHRRGLAMLDGQIRQPQALQAGAPGENLLRLIPGLVVERTENSCSGMAGTFGLKRENYRASLRAGRAPHRKPCMTLSARPVRLSTSQPDFETRLQQCLHWSAEQDEAIERRVKDILADVRARGDAAVLEYTARFDGLQAQGMTQLELSAGELQAAFDQLPAAQRQALEQAAARVRRYHQWQRQQGGETATYRDEDGTLLGGESIVAARCTAVLRMSGSCSASFNRMKPSRPPCSSAGIRR